MTERETKDEEAPAEEVPAAGTLVENTPSHELPEPEGEGGPEGTGKPEDAEDRGKPEGTPGLGREGAPGQNKDDDDDADDSA